MVIQIPDTTVVAMPSLLGHFVWFVFCFVLFCSHFEYQLLFLCFFYCFFFFNCPMHDISVICTARVFFIFF
jgi:hypothetical protein